MSSETLPVPEGWLRDAPPRTLREIFVETVAGSHYPAPDAAWRLILDAWRVIEVASTRADVPVTPSRDEWYAALHVALFRLNYSAGPQPGEGAAV